jgi:hypothetical protein
MTQYCVGDVEVGDELFFLLRDLLKVRGDVIVAVFAYGNLTYLHLERQAAEESSLQFLELAADSLSIDLELCQGIFAEIFLSVVVTAPEFLFQSSRVTAHQIDILALEVHRFDGIDIIGVKSTYESHLD